MTAEIAILNRGAVALAADSAVTITTPTGPKIYESVNKLFSLIKNRPLGAMIFDSADLVGMPWETVLKAYRMDRERFEAPTLREYGEDFLTYLAAKPELISRDLQARFLKASVTTRLMVVRQVVDDAVKDALAATPRQSLGVRRIEALLEDAIKAQEDAVAVMPTPDWAQALPVGDVDQRHGSMIERLIDEVFQQLPLKPRRRKRLHRLVVEWLTKDAGFEPRSGVVLAGYGADEYFPGLLHYQISGIFDDVLRVRLADDQWINPDMYAVIAPFAQRDVVDSFITGLSPRFDNVLSGYLTEVFERGFPEIVEQLTKGLYPTIDTAALRTNLDAIGPQFVNNLRTTLAAIEAQAAQPIVESVGFLPKDELAAMAESLVNLTSLRRRVSITEAQTVGGPVDVAVISRGDGFVWIKRKHYFDAELNPTWSMTHAGDRP